MAKPKESLKDRIAKQRKRLSESGDGGNMIFVKEGITRFRPVFVGAENDFSAEVVHFYLGNEIKGVISPKTLGKPCAIMEAYEKLKNSKKESERQLANKLKPKKKYLMLGYTFKDEDGKEPDLDRGVRLALLAKGSYEDALDLYLDPEQGDFTDPINGYDLKLRRTGKTMMDTEYSTTPCKQSKAHKKFRGPYDLMEYVRKAVPSYEQTEEIIERFLNLPPEDSSDDDRLKKKKKKSKKSDL
jgi:hypothetical protein